MDYKLNRYHEFKERDDDKSLFEDPEGEWVKWKDVKPLLQAYISLNDNKKHRLSITKIDVIREV